MPAAISPEQGRSRRRLMRWPAARDSSSLIGRGFADIAGYMLARSSPCDRPRWLAREIREYNHWLILAGGELLRATSFPKVNNGLSDLLTPHPALAQDHSGPGMSL